VHLKHRIGTPFFRRPSCDTTRAATP
jgi:hypothetical protein